MMETARSGYIKEYTPITMTDLTVPQWLQIYEDPKSQATYTPAEEVIKFYNEPESFIVLDLRNDREPGYLKNSKHLPATELTGYGNIKSEIIDKLITSETSKVKTIVVHCNSSKMRASKVAGWIQDYINETKADFSVTILQGGIVRWKELNISPFTDVFIPL